MGSQSLLKGSQMSPFWTLGIASLIFGFTACKPAEEPNAASNNSCYRNGPQNGIREDTYCGSKLHRDASLSCCGNEAYNPETATCCIVQHGSIPTASVTQGLSEKVSKCCDLKAYNPVNEICCKSTIIAKPAPMAECCGEEVFDKDKQLCCGSYDNKMLLVRKSSHYQCCGHDQYDTKTQCCCLINEEVLQIQFKESDCCVKDSTAAHLCGNEPYDQHTQLCCQSTVVDKPSPTHGCCDKRVHDVENQLCCGPFDDKKILTRNSRDHQCCYNSQFNTKTECCCWKNDTAEIQPRNSSCCDSAAFEGGQHQASVTFPKTSRGPGEAATLELHPICTEPNTHLCGSSCYNPKERRCCERNQKPNWFCTSDQSWTTPTVYDPSTQVCCDGCVSVWKPWIDQCCGQTAYGLAQRGVLCCNNTLYKGREDGEECSEMGIPYNPDKGTICSSQFHGSPGEHCCGTEIYCPRAEICCNGHRHPKSENIYCCGVKAYSIKDPQMKCCAGALYNLTSLEKHGGDTQCCGSILQRPQEVCCSSQDKEVLYSEKTDFRCCGHLYYNTNLWSCCAGRLRSIHEPGQDQRKMIDGSRLLSVNNLNESYLCKEMHIGIVESVSPRGIVFRSVLKIHGKELVKALPLPHILETADHCSSPKLIPGKIYFFNKLKVFTDFNHDSVLQSLHFIISKCSR